jgi:hypothetical protein
MKDYETHVKKSLSISHTPGMPGKVMRKNEGETIKQSEYRSYVGRILYPVKKCIPDCINAIRELCGHLENPGEEQWAALTRLVSYLKGNYKPMKLRAPRELRAGGNSDATWGSDPNDRKSISCRLTHIDQALVDFESKKQTGVSQSSTKAELVSGAKEAMNVKFVEHLMDEILGEGTRETPSFLKIDNEGAIHVANNSAITPRTKHIDIKTRYLQLEVQEERLEVSHVRTEECHADIGTKNLPEAAHKKHSEALHNGVFSYVEERTISSKEDVKIHHANGCWRSQPKITQERSVGNGYVLRETKKEKSKYGDERSRPTKSVQVTWRADSHDTRDEMGQRNVDEMEWTTVRRRSKVKG